MSPSSPTPPADGQGADVPDEPGTDRMPNEVWDFGSLVDDDELSEHGRAARHVAYVDPDVLRALDKGAGS